MNKATRYSCYVPTGGRASWIHGLTKQSNLMMSPPAVMVLLLLLALVFKTTLCTVITVVMKINR